MKHFLVELIGTFFLTLAIALTGNPLCYGLIFAGVLYLSAHVSGGYCNPAITLSLVLRGKHKRDHAAHLMLGQIVGALLALYLSECATGQGFSLPVDPSRFSMACLSEVLLTFFLCAVVLSVISQKLKDTGGLILGFTLVALGYIGGMFNPAISLGSQILCLFSDGGGLDMNSLCVYALCPLIGGAIAALSYKSFQE